MAPPSEPEPDPGDPYARLQYRRLIAWPERIRREAPFLLAVAGRGPERSVLDLGCGTGEHARFLAGEGYRVLGVDRSAAQIAAARAGAPVPGLEFREVALELLADAVPERFGTALCLGNTLVHLDDDAALAGLCRAVHSRLLPGGAWLTQILDYATLFARGQRLLPVNVSEAEGETLVFVRLLQPQQAGRVRFFPTTLRLRPGHDPPVDIVESRSVDLRAWTRADLETALHAAGFTAVDWHGDMQGGPHVARSSGDLVFVAHRP
jgi:SAM-dependent methyltransferase